MATSWPKSLDTIYGGAQTVSDRVKALSGGRFTIEPFAAGEIVPGSRSTGCRAGWERCNVVTALAITTSVKIQPLPLAPACPSASMLNNKTLGTITAVD